MNNAILKSVESALSEIRDTNLNSDHEGYAKARGPISLWVPPEYKNKFDELQAMTNSKFGKLLQEVIKKAIDSAKF